MISGFRRKVDENYALLGYYAASSGNSLPTFRDNLWVPSVKANGQIDSRNVGEELLLLAA